MQSSFALKQHLQSEGAVEFWSKHVSRYQYPTTRKIALLILTMFGSTYTCESSFSHMNAIKTRARCSMTNEKLHECLNIAMTTYEPNYVEIAKSGSVISLTDPTGSHDPFKAYSASLMKCKDYRYVFLTIQTGLLKVCLHTVVLISP